ncbi:hypothetical protein BDR03DRAFT_903306 [Suillus americanus]|nr:hypothetical protein BDR03DRAFT_903306 [Suillus americanus]
MSGPPVSIPADWQMCNAAKSSHETVTGHSPVIDEGFWYRNVVENRHGKTTEGLWGAHVFREKVNIFLRAAFRSLYVDRLKSLPQSSRMSV